MADLIMRARTSDALEFRFADRGHVNRPIYKNDHGRVVRAVWRAGEALVDTTGKTASFSFEDPDGVPASTAATIVGDGHFEATPTSGTFDKTGTWLMRVVLQDVVTGLLESSPDAEFEVREPVADAHPWLPHLLPGVVLELDPARGITLAGADVAGWADQSPQGNDFIQGDTAKDPLFVASGFNGGGGDDLPFVRFDGAAEYMANAAMDLGGAQASIWFAALMQLPSGPTNNALVAQYADVGGRPSLGGNTTDRVRVYSNGAAGVANATLAPAADAYIVVGEAYADRATIWVDGVQIDTDAGTALALTDGQAAGIGGSSAGANLEEVDLAYLLMGVRELTASDHALLLAWAQSKAGI